MPVAVPLLTARGIEKAFGNRVVLADVEFTIHHGERLGLVGLNGAGKSTMMRIVAAMTHPVGEDEHRDPGSVPDSGELVRPRGTDVIYVAQEPEFPAEQTVDGALKVGLRHHADVHARLEALEESIAGITDDRALDEALEEQATLHERLIRLGGWDLQHEVDALRTALRLPPPAAGMHTLSGGERRRVALAQALLARPDVLLLDEPTNHLDTAAIEWLQGHLIAQADALLVVTHDRAFLDGIATRILELDRGRVYSYPGNYSAFIVAQAERLTLEATAEDKRQSFVRRELEWVRRKESAQRKKSSARVAAFEAVVASAPGRDDRRPDPMDFHLPPGPRLGKTVLEAHKIWKTLGGKLLFKDLDLTILPGERLGIVGPNGVGKTTLVKTLLGQVPPDKGQVLIGVNTRVAAMDQGRVDLDDEKTVLEEVSEGSDFVPLADGPVHVRTFLRQMLFHQSSMDTRIGDLSGGERNRVMLARLLRRAGNLLVLDEPTNDLDLITLGVLEEALCEFPGAAIIVSHDRWFLDRVATAIIAFEGDGRVVRYAGNWSDWQRSRGRPEVVEGPRSVVREAPKAEAAAAPAAQKRRLSWKEQKELEGMEAAIERAERTASDLELELGNPATFKRGPDVVKALAAKAAVARAEVERLYARWTELG